jgi:hypothetical protein
MKINSPENVEQYNIANLKLNPENFKQIIEIIGKIEGEYWTNKQESCFIDEKLKNEPNRYTIQAALQFIENLNKHMEGLQRELESTKDADERAGIEEEIKKYKEGFGPKAEIYGAGAINRYYVLSNGEIVLSGSHMGANMKQNLEQAKKLGIQII